MNIGRYVRHYEINQGYVELETSGYDFVDDVTVDQWNNILPNQINQVPVKYRDDVTVRIWTGRDGDSPEIRIVYRVPTKDVDSCNFRGT